jgi:hypothetical protein
MDAPIWVPTVFSHNRDRLLKGEIDACFMAALLNPPQVKGLLSDEHFSVDGTLIEAWASMKSLRPRMAAANRRPLVATQRVTSMVPPSSF